MSAISGELTCQPPACPHRIRNPTADSSAQPKSKQHVLKERKLRLGKDRSPGCLLPESVQSTLTVCFCEGTLCAPAHHHLNLQTLTIWFLTVFLNDLVDLLVQVFVLTGYLERRIQRGNVVWEHSSVSLGIQDQPSRQFYKFYNNHEPSLHTLPHRCDSMLGNFLQLLVPKDIALRSWFLRARGELQLECCALEGQLPFSTLVAHSDRHSTYLPVVFEGAQMLRASTLCPSPPSSRALPLSSISLVFLLLSTRKN